MNESSRIAQTMPRSCSSWDGCTTRAGRALPIKSSQSTTLPRVSKLVSNIGLDKRVDVCNSSPMSIQIPLTLRAGTCSVELSWEVKSSTRHTKHINRRSTGMEGTPPFGALSECFTTRSTSTETPWMPTLVPSDSTPTSAKSGSTLGAFTSPAIIRSTTPSTPMPEPPTSIPTTLPSNHDLHCSGTLNGMDSLCRLLRLLRMFILPPTLRPLVLGRSQLKVDLVDSLLTRVLASVQDLTGSLS